MNSSQNKPVLSEIEYRKKVLSDIYASDEPRDVLIDKGKKQVEELLTTEKKIKEQMEKIAQKYENQ